MSIDPKISKCYRAIALLSFNTILVFVLLNLCFALVYRAKEHLAGPHRHPISEMATVYPGLAEGKIEALLRETWTRPFSYEPFTQFRETPFTGRYVNVAEAGFRLGWNQGPWPPNESSLNIFVFGGSTTFGYGLPDDQTIGSELQRFLRGRVNQARVYNFGRGHYFSTQELVLFERLLAAGFQPDLAVFVDGLNEFSHPDGLPALTDQMEDFIAHPDGSTRALSALPVIRAFASAKLLIRRHVAQAREIDEKMLDDERYFDQTLIAGVLKRYTENKRLIDTAASEYGVNTLFVWQPIPTYNYNIEHHLFRNDIPPRQMYSRMGYRAMKERLAHGDLGENFLWCADLQLGHKEPLYVDAVHYNAKLSSLLAEAIAKEILRDDEPILPQSARWQ